MKRPNISFLIDSLNDGGSERQLTIIIRNLLDCGVAVSVFSWSGQPTDKYVADLRNWGVEITFLASLSKKQRIHKIRKSLKKQCSTLISFSFHLNFVAVLCTIGKPLKAIGSIRSSYNNIEPPISTLSRILHFFLTKRILSNNQRALKELKSAGRKWLYPDKLTYLSNKMKVPPLISTPIGSTPLKSVSVGRIDDNKRIDWIIKAVYQLKQAGVLVEHVHAGEGLLKKEMEKLKGELEISDRFHFAGKVNNIPAFLQKADLFLHAAYSEGSPNVLMEAAAHGIPVVSTDCGDAGVITPHESCGLIANADNWDEWYSMVHELATSSKKRSRFAVAAHSHVSEQFSAQNLRKDLLQLFDTYKIKLPCAE